MQEKIYTFKGLKFKLKPYNLTMLHNAAPLLITYRKLLWQHTKDIDMSEADKMKSHISELETAVQQLKQGSEEEIAKAEEISAKLMKIKDEFEKNSGIQSVLKLYSDSEKLAMFELITDYTIIKPFLLNVLEGFKANDGRKCEVNMLDFSDAEIFELIKEVISDFFLLIAKNS